MSELDDIRRLKQDKFPPCVVGPAPLSSEGNDGDVIYKVLPDKGMQMFYKHSGAWYSVPLTANAFTIEEQLNTYVSTINITEMVIDGLDFTPVVVHGDLTDTPSVHAIDGNAHTQYALVNSFGSDTLAFTTAQEAGNISTGAVDVVKDSTSLSSSASGLKVNESAHAFALEQQLTLSDVSSTPLQINSTLENKISFTDTATVSIGSSDAGDIIFKPVHTKNTLFQGNNSDNNTGLASSSYTSGWAGTGWTLTRPTGGFSAGEWMLEVDNLSVRGTMTVFELLINQIRATNGTLFVSSVAKVFSLEDDSDYPTSYGHLAFEPQGSITVTPFDNGDILMCQRVDPNSTVDAYSSTNTNFIKRILIWVQDDNYGSVTIGGTAYPQIQFAYYSEVYPGESSPAAVGTIGPGDVFVRIGNTSNAARRSSILLTSDFANAPFIDFLDGVDSWTAWTGNVKKARIGNLTGIVDTDLIGGGTLSGFGIYADNAYLKGELHAETGYIGTKEGGWKIDSTGITTQGTGRKIVMGSVSAGWDTYNNAENYFIAEMYTDTAIYGRFGLGTNLTYNTKDKKLKLAGDQWNYIEFDPVVPANALNIVSGNTTTSGTVLNFNGTTNVITIGNDSATTGKMTVSPTLVEMYGGNTKKFFKLDYNSNAPTLEVGDLTAANSTNWIKLTSTTFELKNKDAAGAVTSPISMNSEGDVVIIGSLSIPQDAGSIQDAQDAADDAQDDIDAALIDISTLSGLLLDIADDDKVTPSEKTTAKLAYETIISERVNIILQANAAGVNFLAYSAAYDALILYLNTTTSMFLAMGITTDIDRADWNTAWGDYYQEKADLLTALHSDSEYKADVADGVADDAQIKLGLLPSTATPAVAGLYADNSYLGYHTGTGGEWMTFMKNDGTFYLGGTSGALQWNGSNLTVVGGGTFTGAIEAGSIDADTTITGSEISGSFISGGAIHAPKVPRHGTTAANVATYGTGPIIHTSGFIDTTATLPTAASAQFSNVRYNSKGLANYTMGLVDFVYTFEDVGMEVSYDAGATWEPWGSYLFTANSGSASTSTGWGPIGHSHGYNQGGHVISTNDHSLVRPALTGANAFTARFRINAVVGSGEFASIRLIMSIFSNN